MPERDATPEESADDLAFRLALYRQCKEDAAWLRERFEEWREREALTFWAGSGVVKDRGPQTRLPV